MLDAYIQFCFVPSSQQIQLNERCSCDVLCHWLAHIFSQCLWIVHTQMEVVLHAVAQCHDTKDSVPDSYSMSVL